jgi:hypothetical protein
MPIIPALGKQEVLKFKVNLSYLVRLCLKKPEITDMSSERYSRNREQHVQRQRI